MDKIMLTDNELDTIKPGEAISIATILALMAIAIVAIAAYKLFTTNDGLIKFPGGYQFSWG